MDKRVDKKKIFLIVCVCLLIFAITGVTLARYSNVLFSGLGANTITHGLDYYIEYNKGTDISGASLNPSTDYNGGVSTEVELWKNDDVYDIYGHIYLDVNEVGTNLATSSALKYAIVNNGNVITEGVLKDLTDDGTLTVGDSLAVKLNIPLALDKQLYKVYVWLDSTLANSSLSGESLSLTIRCEATMEKINVFNLLEHITTLYSSNVASTPTDTGNGTYYYADSVRLMNDGLDSTGTEITDTTSLLAGTSGNIRYYGAEGDTLNNYIYFNCDTYPETNCEKWRIIGIVDGKVKIMRNERIGEYPWDLTSTGEYDNNWNDATLMTLLNNGYYYSDVQVLNYILDIDENLEIITTEKTINFGNPGDGEVKGITEATRTKGIIDTEATWYINGVSSAGLYSNAIYKAERTGIDTWSGAIALAYPSDYGYAADLRTCKSQLRIYNETTCTSVNWMKNVIAYNETRSGSFITPYSGSTKSSWHVTPYGYVYNGNYVSGETHVLPVLYLNTDLTITLDGDGSNGNPYKISVN